MVCLSEAKPPQNGKRWFGRPSSLFPHLVKLTLTMLVQQISQAFCPLASSDVCTSLSCRGVVAADATAQVELGPIMKKKHKRLNAVADAHALLVT